MGPRALGRRARPPEDQVGHARVREDRRAPALPLLRQRHVRRARVAARTCSRTTTRSSTRPARRRTARSASPAKTCPASHAATEFVGWYNGHPDHTDLEVDLLSAERAVVIGNGNVALDVARMLVLAPSELAPTDTADHALEVLADEPGARGRRRRAPRTGPGRLHEPRAARARRARRRRRDRRRRRARARRSRSTTRTPRRTSPPGATSRSCAATPSAAPAGPRRSGSCCASCSRRRRCVPDERGHVGVVELVRNELVASADGRLRAQADRGARDDRRGPRVPRDRLSRHPAPGRAVRRAPRRDPQRGRARPRPRDAASRSPGEYVVGWIKRGPSGVIGTNKKDAQETVDAMLADLARGGDTARRPAPRRIAGRRPRSRRCCAHASRTLVTYDGWEAIDRHERALGEPAGRPRVKLTRIEEMLRVAAAESPLRGTSSGSRGAADRSATQTVAPQAPLAHLVERRTLIRWGGFESRTGHGLSILRPGTFVPRSHEKAPSAAKRSVLDAQTPDAPALRSS